MTLLFSVVVLTGLFLWCAHAYVGRFEGLRPGDTLPLAKLQTLDGQPLETGSWLGRPTLLMVFNPDCLPCRLELRSLVSVATHFPKLRIALLSTKTDAGSLQIPFPVYVDANGAFLARVQRLVTPALYWIGTSGRVMYARTGQRDPAEEEKILQRLQEGEK